MHQHLLRVSRSVVEFDRLIAAVRQNGMRAGWLELPEWEGNDGEPTSPLPESLRAAARADVLRAVAIDRECSVAVKPRRGAPVLRDLLREHFRGCQLVLVSGEVEAPLLEPDGDDWALTVPGRAATRWVTVDLVNALRKPRPWGRDTP